MNRRRDGKTGREEGEKELSLPCCVCVLLLQRQLPSYDPIQDIRSSMLLLKLVLVLQSASIKSRVSRTRRGRGKSEGEGKEEGSETDVLIRLQEDGSQRLLVEIDLLVGLSSGLYDRVHPVDKERRGEGRKELEADLRNEIDSSSSLVSIWLVDANVHLLLPSPFL